MVAFADPEVRLVDAIHAPLPRPPVESYVTAHWLAVDGRQPAVPENPVVAPPVLAAAAVEVVPPVAHVVSKELQLYFETVTRLVETQPGGAPRPVLASLEADAGLQPLAPYFAQWLGAEAAARSGGPSRLRAALAAAEALLRNPGLSLSAYLQQLMPALLTCCVSKRLSAAAPATADVPPQDTTHWTAREAGARVLAVACARHGGEFPHVLPRVQQTLLKALQDEGRPAETLYGGVVGLHALGLPAVRLLLVPNAAALHTRLARMADAAAPAASADLAAATAQRDAALRVLDVLRSATGAVCAAALSAAAPPGVVPGPRSRRRVLGRVAAAGMQGGSEHAPAPLPPVLAVVPPPPRPPPPSEPAAAAALWLGDPELGVSWGALSEAYGDAWLPYIACPALALTV